MRQEKRWLSSMAIGFQCFASNSNRVETSIREKFHWISNNETCYIVMDNTGSHRTDSAIKEYTAMLKD